jgi:hypothetical protein
MSLSVSDLISLPDQGLFVCFSGLRIAIHSLFGTVTVTGKGLIHCKKLEKALTFCRGKAAVQYNYRKEKEKGREKEHDLGRTQDKTDFHRS